VYAELIILLNRFKTETININERDDTLVKDLIYEDVELIGIVKDLGNLSCACFHLKTTNGMLNSVRYGDFIDETRSTIDISQIKNDDKIKIKGIREKNKPNSDIRLIFFEIL